MKKYKLEHYFENFVNNAVFPLKAQWKAIVMSYVKNVETISLNITLDDVKLTRFSSVYGKSMYIHPILSLENITRGNKKYIRDFAQTQWRSKWSY